MLRKARANGIGAGVHYPTPVHLTPAMAEFGGGTGSMPVSEHAAGEILSLPLFPGITVEQQERVADVVRNALGAVHEPPSPPEATRVDGQEDSQEHLGKHAAAGFLWLAAPKWACVSVASPRSSC